MSIHRYACIVLSLACAPFTAADWITEWGGNELGTDYDITQPSGVITIIRGDGNTYKFYSETSEGSGVPGVINNITVDPNASGNFTLLIDHPTGGERGAEHWKAGDLTYSGGTCTIAGVDLSGNLCADGSNGADIVVEVVNGDINVGGHLSVSSALDRTFTANSVTGDINLGGCGVTWWSPAPSTAT